MPGRCWRAGVERQPPELQLLQSYDARTTYALVAGTTASRVRSVADAAGLTRPSEEKGKRAESASFPAQASLARLPLDLQPHQKLSN